MKREYTRPTVEKLAFNYRNQVVAASGIAENSADNPTDTVSREEQLRQQFEQFLKDIFNSIFG